MLVIEKGELIKKEGNPVNLVMDFINRQLNILLPMKPRAVEIKIEDKVYYGFGVKDSSKLRENFPAQVSLALARPFLDYDYVDIIANGFDVSITAEFSPSKKTFVWFRVIDEPPHKERVLLEAQEEYKRIKEKRRKSYGVDD